MLWEVFLFVSALFWLLVLSDPVIGCQPDQSSPSTWWRQRSLNQSGILISYKDSEVTQDGRACFFLDCSHWSVTLSIIFKFCCNCDLLFTLSYFWLLYSPLVVCAQFWLNSILTFSSSVDDWITTCCMCSILTQLDSHFLIKCWWLDLFLDS